MKLSTTGTAGVLLLGFVAVAPAHPQGDRGPRIAAVRPEAAAPSANEEESAYAKAERLVKAGRIDEAEATYRDWAALHPESAVACGWLARFLLKPLWNGNPRWDDGISTSEHCLTLEDPANVDARQTIATLYWDKAYRDPLLTDEQKDRYADAGLGHVNKALEIKPNLIDALVYKGLLLRIKAQVAKSPGQRAEYLKEAAQLQKHALDLKRRGEGEMSGVRMPLPPEPPSPPEMGSAVGAVPRGAVGGVLGVRPAVPPPPQAVRVGGAIKEPRKLKHVDPVYPDIALQARVQGVVILECTISPEGQVSETKVLRGVPLLDASAQEAVAQWEYTPTLLNGVPVAVIMTVTVNFRVH